jgi:hypothetical protein
LAIDAANADDPNRIEVRGVTLPKEQAHAAMVSEWVKRLRPDAPEALLLAAHAHHIRRWMIPRDSYPPGRQGYLDWRRKLHEFHAAELRRILVEEGYDEATIALAESMVRKRHLHTDPNVQSLEDALCLVFLETQLDEIASRLDEAKVIDVVRKTLRKMSARAISEVASLPLSGRARELLAIAAGDAGRS